MKQTDWCFSLFDKNLMPLYRIHGYLMQTKSGDLIYFLFHIVLETVRKITFLVFVLITIGLNSLNF